MAPIQAQCYRCGNVLNSEYDFARADRCSKCGIDTRCCKNCANYDKSKYNECTEPVADRVVDKEKSNFCDFFKPSDKAVKAVNPADAAKAAADALFKKK